MKQIAALHFDPSTMLRQAADADPDANPDANPDVDGLDKRSGVNQVSTSQHDIAQGRLGSG